MGKDKEHLRTNYKSPEDLKASKVDIDKEFKFYQQPAQPEKLSLGLNLVQATERACKEPSLIDALTFICVWESERIVKQARENPTWETCFKISLKSVLDNYKPLCPECGHPMSEHKESGCSIKVGHLSDTGFCRCENRPPADQEKPSQMPLIVIPKNILNEDIINGVGIGRQKQRDADMVWHNEQKALIAKQAVAEFAEKCINAIPDKVYDAFGEVIDNYIAHIKSMAREG